MSADNWTICPRCEAKRQKRIDALEAKTNRSYGVVSVTEWEALREQLDEARKLDPPKQLREDYEIGIVESLFEVDFRSSCSACGFSFEFKHSAQVIKP